MENIRTMKLEEIRETLEELKARIAEVEAQLTEFEDAAEEVPEQACADGSEGISAGVSTNIPANVSTDLPDDSAMDIPGDTATDIPENGSTETSSIVTEDLPEGTAEEPIDMGPIDISIDDLDIEPVRFEPEPVVVENAKPIEAKSLEEAIMESEQEQAKEQAKKQEQEKEKENWRESGKENGKVISINDKEEKRARKAVVDVLGEKFPWRTAVQGSPVKNVISAISLNDRVLFINTLFKEDPLAFQDAIAAFNSMTTLEEAEKYVFENFPEWNFSSDTVFKLMMAVRRKLN